MRDVFVDTNYWIAFISPADQWRKRALEAEREIGIVHLVTTEAVLVEVLNHFGSFRHDIKTAAARIVRRMLGDEMEVEIVPTTSDAFLTALAFYESRADKGYSLTDCLSINVMRERRIKEVLTHDHHFAQEGFSVLL